MRKHTLTNTVLIGLMNSPSKRNNNINGKGWKVLRYPTRDLTKNMEARITQIKATIDKNGGI